MVPGPFDSSAVTCDDRLTNERCADYTCVTLWLRLPLADLAPNQSIAICWVYAASRFLLQMAVLWLVVYPFTFDPLPWRMVVRLWRVTFTTAPILNQSLLSAGTCLYHWTISLLSDSWSVPICSLSAGFASVSCIKSAEGSTSKELKLTQLFCNACRSTIAFW